MTVASELPPQLAPWAASLTGLTPQLAIALGPLVRQLDSLLQQHSEVTAAQGELEGYGGLATRGDFGRLLISEWLLADELPSEFLRRAISGELQYLSPEYRATTPKGRVAVLTDTGPDQWGACRLVQLAALVVLHRRAHAAGSELALGVLGDPPGHWRTGDLADLLPQWLSARRAADPSAADIQAWRETCAAPDEVWILAGARLGAELPRQQRMVVTEEGTWGAGGVESVTLSLQGHCLELTMPAYELAVRALRGAEFRRSGAQILLTEGGLRAPRFNSIERRLLARGNGSQELLSLIAPTVPRQDVRLRRHHFPGPVLAASPIGRRLVTAVLVDEAVLVRVVGKELGSLADLRVPLQDLGLDAHSVLAASEHTLPPLYYDRGTLLCPLGDTWHRLSASNGPVAEPIVAIAPGSQSDQPLIAWRDPDHIWVGSLAIPPAAQVVLGAKNTGAWSVDRTAWNTFTGSEVGPILRLNDEAKPVALYNLDGRPHLLTTSDSGVILRLVGEQNTKTLTRWASGLGPPSAHPAQPLLAVLRESGTVELANFQTGERLALVAVSQSP